MTVEELEAEVTRLRGLLDEQRASNDAVARRIAEVNGHHERLRGEIDSLTDDIRATNRSVRFLLRKARGEEESV